MYLEPFEYENQNKDKVLVDSPLKKRNGEVLTNKDGEEIYGINLSKSNYQCPITSVDECYAIINYNYEEKFSISEKVVLNILSDLSDCSYVGEYSNYDEVYDKYYSDIDKAAISSIINGSYVYYEPIESIDYSLGNRGFEPVGWWYLCLKAMDSEKTSQEFFDDYKYLYQDELENIYKN